MLTASNSLRRAWTLKPTIKSLSHSDTQKNSSIQTKIIMKPFSSGKITKNRLVSVFVHITRQNREIFTMSIRNFNTNGV